MYFVKRLIVIVVIALLVMLMCLAILSLTGEGNRIHDFLSGGSRVKLFIQLSTLYAFVLALTLLCYRLVVYLSSRNQLRSLKQGKYGWRSHNFPLGEHLHAIRKSLAKDSGEVALSYAQDFIQGQKNNIQKAYELINFLVCSLPALGLLGTMLGLSQALFEAFSNGKFGAESTKRFIESLGTALDTTVLALICALLAGTFAWLLHRVESEHTEQEANFVRNLFSLDQLALKLKRAETTHSVGNHFSAVIKTLKVELQPLMAETFAEVTSKFDKSLQDVAEFYRSSLNRAVDGVINGQRSYDAMTVEKVTTHFNKTVDRIGTVIVEHNNHVVNTVASELKNITGMLDKRIPGELIIRYNRNEEPAMEMNDVV